MGLPCSICNHPNRAAVEQAISEKKTLTGVAATFGVSRSALQRHRAHAERRAAASAAAVAAWIQSQLVLMQLEEVYAETEKLLSSAMDRKDTGTALKAIQRMERQLGLAMRIQTGRLGGAKLPAGSPGARS